MKFNLGLSPSHRFPDIKELLDIVKVAEDLGFYSIQIPEHLLAPKSQRDVLHPFFYDPLVLGTAVAMKTRRAKIFFNVLVLPYHHPVKLAKALVTLDHVSGGRVIAGVGVGWLEEEFQVMGVPFKRRGAMTHEWVKAMKELWTSSSPSFKGEFVQFNDIHFAPPPVQKPHIPIWIGGGVRKSFERAAELGDGWHPLSRPWEQLVAETEEVKRLLAERGRSTDDFTFSYTVDYAARSQVIRPYASRSGAGEPIILNHNAEAASKQLDALRKLGFSHLMVRFGATNAKEYLAEVEDFHKSIIRPLGLEAKA